MFNQNSCVISAILSQKWKSKKILLTLIDRWSVDCQTSQQWTIRTTDGDKWKKEYHAKMIQTAPFLYFNSSDLLYMSSTVKLESLIAEAHIHLNKSVRFVLITSPQASPPHRWLCSSSTSARLMFQGGVYSCTFCDDKREQVAGQECISRVIGLCAGKI